MGVGLRYNTRDWLAGGRSIEGGVRMQGECTSLLEEELLRFSQWRHAMGPSMSWWLCRAAAGGVSLCGVPCTCSVAEFNSHLRSSTVKDPDQRGWWSANCSCS